MEVIISFTILDDLKHTRYNDLKEMKLPEQDRIWSSRFPIHRLIKFTRCDIKEFVDEMKIHYHNNTDAGNFAWDPEDTDFLIQSLLTDKYAVINIVEKYYVVAFAINGTRFEVYSEGCAKKLIEWGDQIPKGPVAGNGYESDDYIENPIMAAFKSIFNAQK